MKLEQFLKKYSSRNNKVRIIGFSRNFGHQIAVTAGIDASNGDAVVLEVQLYLIPSA
ncbi:glycosyltransferase [Escherichia coli]